MAVKLVEAFEKEILKSSDFATQDFPEADKAVDMVRTALGVEIQKMTNVVKQQESTVGHANPGMKQGITSLEPVVRAADLHKQPTDSNDTSPAFQR